MRYNVGEVRPFVRVTFDYKGDEGTATSLFHPKFHKNPVVDVKMLEIVEHHKVPVEYYEDRGPTADGFILREIGTNVQWVNQYPNASYGQLDTSEDQRVRRDDLLSDEDFLKLSEAEQARDAKLYWEHYVDGLAFMSEIEKALVGRHALDFGDDRAEFERYKDQVKAAIEVATGKKIGFRDKVFTNSKTGESRTIPGVVEAFYM